MKLSRKIIPHNDDKLTTRDDVEHFLKYNEKHLRELVKYIFILDLISFAEDDQKYFEEYSYTDYCGDVDDLIDELFYEWNDYSVLKFFLYNFILLNRIESAYNPDINNLNMETYSIFNKFEKIMSKEYSRILKFNEEILIDGEFTAKIYDYFPTIGGYRTPLLQQTRKLDSIRVNSIMKPTKTLLELLIAVSSNFPESIEFIEYFKKSIKVPYYMAANYIDEKNYHLLLTNLENIINIMDYSSTFHHNEDAYYRDVDSINKICGKLNSTVTVNGIPNHPILINREYNSYFTVKEMSVNNLTLDGMHLYNTYNLALTIQFYLEYVLDIERTEAVKLTLEYVNAHQSCFGDVEEVILIDYVKVFEEYFSEERPPLDWSLSIHSREFE